MIDLNNVQYMYFHIITKLLLLCIKIFLDHIHSSYNFFSVQNKPKSILLILCMLLRTKYCLGKKFKIENIVQSTYCHRTFIDKTYIFEEDSNRLVLMYLYNVRCTDLMSFFNVFVLVSNKS